MAKMKIKVERTWDALDVRKVCISNNFYTRGDNEAYGRMFLYIENHKPTKESIYRVAEDIYEHSDIDLDQYGVTKDEMIAGMMFEISRKCVTEHFTIERA